jgi:predicted transcriptional regulator
MDAKIQKYKELVSTGELAKMKDQIYWLIKEMPGITIDKIQAITGRKNGTIGGRLSDLRDAGMIKPTGIDNGQSGWKITTEEEAKEIILNRMKDKCNRAINCLLDSSLISDERKLALVNAWAELNGLNHDDLTELEKEKIIKNKKR